jgi:hypothetical protein
LTNSTTKAKSKKEVLTVDKVRRKFWMRFARDYLIAISSKDEDINFEKIIYLT